MTLPTVHVNGTSKDELVRQHLAVSHAARGLLLALRNAAPNGRDFYPQGDAAFAAAQMIHKGRVEWVETLIVETELATLNIMNQELIDMPRNIDWDALADDYRNAQTDEEREAAYQAIVAAYATDPDLPDYADPEAGADSFLHERGLMR